MELERFDVLNQFDIRASKHALEHIRSIRVISCTNSTDPIISDITLFEDIKCVKQCKLEVKQNITIGELILSIFMTVMDNVYDLYYLVTNFDVICRKSSDRKILPVASSGAISLYEFDLNEKIRDIYVEDFKYGCFQISRISDANNKLSKLHDYVLRYT